ncbi:phage terminase large subunit [Bradyrhizobium sp. USDA 3686]|uniref:PBSX family phage terminase large subunit n=1 Tax=Bradyrhizobium canariense TaxID=255045 RepID=UPI00195E671D|nr:phage terminase large subunit [Bradyrhizobium canariense]MBM7483332.1 phage terminase large subunit [Bradyrhizobium canariense]
MPALHIPTAEVFEPLLKPARYKGAKGGRGSGKSHFFAGLLVEDSVREPGDFGEGLRSVCIREVLKDLKDSAKLLIEDKLAQYRLGAADGFKVYRDVIQTPKDGLIIFKGMQDYSAESIKSLEGFGRAWIEEAQTLKVRSLSLLRPTIRRERSEIWASWNPRRRQDAIDDFLVAHKPEDSEVVTANWQDNPWFPEVLEKERLHDLANYPERYGHIWGGEYATIYEGAYFATLLAEAKEKGRIGVVAADPLLPLRAFIDIGGAGASADAFTIWIVQWVGQQIKVLDYYESRGQVLAFHVNWLRKSGYQDAILYLPHDGVATNNVTGKRYEDHLREAGFKVEPPIKNQGRGAAMMRVEALRRLGPQLWFNADTTEPGREALGFYHERKDEARNIGLGPDHDWSSHAADSLGLMAIAYEDPERVASFNKKIDYPDLGYV